MLYLLQFACLIFMFISAFFIAVTRLHVRWINRRYEWSRWMIFAALLFMAVHFFLQMYFGFRAMGEDVGAVINVLVYLPCFTLFSMAIYNIEATHTKRRKMNLICAAVYAAMLAAFAVGYSFSGSLNIGAWLYVMLALFFGNMVYCIYMVKKEMTKRKRILETMAATDMVPFLRYARASVVMLLLTAVSMPFAILSTKSLYIIGPVALLVLLFFIVNFVAFGNCYVPTEELLDRERGNGETDDDDEPTTTTNRRRQRAAPRSRRLTVSSPRSASQPNAAPSSRRRSTSGVQTWAIRTVRSICLHCHIRWTSTKTNRANSSANARTQRSVYGSARYVSMLPKR